MSDEQGKPSIVDVQSLGKKVVTYTEVVPVKDPATGLRVLKSQVLQKDEYHPILTDEEAMQLRGAKWQPTPPELPREQYPPFMCTGTGRRFFANINPNEVDVGVDQGGQNDNPEVPVTVTPPAPHVDIKLPPALDEKLQKLMLKADWDTAEKILDAGRASLMNIDGVGAATADKIIEICSDYVSTSEAENGDDE